MWGARAHPGLNTSGKGTAIRPRGELRRGRNAGPAMRFGKWAPRNPPTPRAGLGFSVGPESPSCLFLKQ